MENLELAKRLFAAYCENSDVEENFYHEIKWNNLTEDEQFAWDEVAGEAEDYRREQLGRIFAGRIFAVGS
jgi:hypothetical protein